MHISRSGKPNVIITMGDPGGIGPEVTLKALASSKISGLANFFVIGDGIAIGDAGRKAGLGLKVRFLDLENIPKSSFSYGKVDPLFGKASIRYVDKAMGLLKAGKADALVTGPINKASVTASGISGFEGHTEYLARHTGTKDFAMMFVGKRLKIVLVTRHIRIKDVPAGISSRSILRTLLLTHKSLVKYFNIKHPRIGVAGLNPHAGEGGLFGDEEDRIIVPAIKKVSERISGVYGPVPPDVVFYECLNKKYDAVVSLYHDQALIPFKLLHFKDGVNLTLGLPFIRTSPDHGTAFDIAGKGVADPSSMIEAIKLACRLSAR